MSENERPPFWRPNRRETFKRAAALMEGQVEARIERADNGTPSVTSLVRDAAEFGAMAGYLHGLAEAQEADHA